MKPCKNGGTFNFYIQYDKIIINISTKNLIDGKQK